MLRRASAPIRAPARRVIRHYHDVFEGLLHAAKMDVVERLDALDGRIDELEELVTGSHQTLADQLAVQSASLRTLAAELERLQDLSRRLAERVPPGAGAVGSTPKA